MWYNNYNAVIIHWRNRLAPSGQPASFTKEAKVMADSKGYIVKEQENGTVNISEDVIAALAASAVGEVDGIKNPSVIEDTKLKKNLTKYVKADCGDDGINIDVNIVVKYGYQIKNVSAAVQDRVSAMVESVSGVKVNCVNVNVTGIAFEKK
jgi:uncharacterized alkaline shock family protein YloU